MYLLYNRRPGLCVYLGELLPENGELLVVRPEVVTPLGHAVGLVNHKPGQLAPVVQRLQGVQQLRADGATRYSSITVVA